MSAEHVVFSFPVAPPSEEMGWFGLLKKIDTVWHLVVNLYIELHYFFLLPIDWSEYYGQLLAVSS